MKRIRNKILLLFVLIVGMTFNVKAGEFEYFITNSNNYEPINNSDVKETKRGDTITVTAMLHNGKLVTDYKISSGKLTIRWDDKFVSLQEVNGKYYNDSITDISGLTISSVNKSSNKLTIGEISSTGTLKTYLNKLVEFKFKVLDNASTGTFKIYQMDGEDSLKCTKNDGAVVSCGDSSLSELKYNISKSKINTLSAIKINGHTLDYFDENTNNYDFEVDADVEKINIEVVKKDSKSTISGNYGENPVKYGKNKFVINVISESGERNTYNINVTRDDLRSNDNSLKTITVSSGEIDFKPDVLEYNITVENDVDKITITSSLNDDKAKYVEDFKEKTINLVEGSNKAEIKVVSQKGEEKTYILNINRLLSSNNSLKLLKIDDEKIDLKEGIFTYNFIVENDVEEVVIKAEANDVKATVKLNDKYPLEVGDNEIKIVVTAASGNEAIYTLNITRNKLLSRDSLLTSINIKGYNLDFKQEKTVYDLKIGDNVDELEITTTQEDPNATVEIEGNKNLENGSIIKINVKAEDGSFTRYFINIEKGSSGISPVIIIIIVLLLLLGGCLGLIFYRKKKQEEKEFDKLDDETSEVKENEEDNDNENEVNQVEENTKDDTSYNDVEKKIYDTINNQIKAREIIERGSHEYNGVHEYKDSSLNEQMESDNEKGME